MIKKGNETFSGYNKPKRTPGKSKKFAVLAKSGSRVKLVRFGDPNMRIKKSNPARRKSFRARHRCSTAKNKLTARSNNPLGSCIGVDRTTGNTAIEIKRINPILIRLGTCELPRIGINIMSAPTRSKTNKKF